MMLVLLRVHDDATLPSGEERVVMHFAGVPLREEESSARGPRPRMKPPKGGAIHSPRMSGSGGLFLGPATISPELIDGISWNSYLMRPAPRPAVAFDRGR